MLLWPQQRDDIDMVSHQTRRVAINWGLLLSAKVFQTLVSLVLVSLLARYLGKASFGRYGFIISFVELFVVFAEMGLSKILVREVAGDLSSTRVYLSGAWSLRLLLSALVLVAVLATLSLTGQEREVWLAIQVYCLGQILFTLTETFNSIFRAYQRMEYQVLVMVIAQVLMLGLTVAFIYFHLGLVAIFAAALLANTVKLAVAHRLTATLFSQHSLSRDVQLMKYLAKESVPVGLSLLLRRYIWRGGVILLVAWQGEVAGGILYGPLRIIEQMRIVPMSLVAAILPVLSSRAHPSREAFTSSFEKTFKVFIILSLLLAVTLTFLAEPIVTLLFGPKLRESARILGVLGWTIVFFFPNFLFGTVLTARGRQVVETLGLALGLGAGLTAGLALIPSYGALGICYAILLAEGTFFLVGLASTWRYLPITKLILPLAKVVLSSVAMGSFFYLSRTHSFFIVAPLGACLFLGCLFLLRAFDEEEMKAWKSMVLRAKGET